MSASATTAANEPSAPTPAATSAAAFPRFPVLLAGLWFGLAVGILELLVLGYLEFIAGSPVWVSGQVLWMAPLADAVLFLAAAIPLAVLGTTRWRSRVPALTTGTLSFLACASVLLMFGLHRAALGLLAAGVGVQAARLVQARPERFARLMRRTLSWLVASVAAAGLVTNGWWRLSERRALAALPAAAADAPNVILLILDTVRAKSLGLYGYEAPTSPQLDRLAGRGVTFERAIAPSPWTLPSHASVFTGRWAHELSADWEVPLDETYPTLAEVLSARGYATAGFVANIPYTSRRHGLARGFLHYEDWPVSAAQVVLSSSVGRAITNTAALRRLTGYRDILNRKRATHINRDLLDWAATVDDRPFFAFANYYDAHEPYLPKKPWAGKFGPLADLDLAYFTIDAWLPGRHELGAREIQLERNAYDASIAGLDDGLGALVDELDRRGLMSNTLLIITADHGEQFGEHGRTNHGNTLYLPLLHVPLILMFDGRLPAGRRIPEPVSLRDLPATVLDLLDADSPLPGRSLAPLWEDSPGTGTPQTSPIFANLTAYTNRPANSPYFHGDMASVIEGRYQLITKADGSAELYDMVADPDQLDDRADDAAYRDVLLRLRRMASALVRPRSTAPPPGGG